MSYYLFFFFKQSPAYEMRISDWSSDVCSSDLGLHDRRLFGGERGDHRGDVGGSAGAPRIAVAAEQRLFGGDRPARPSGGRGADRRRGRRLCRHRPWTLYPAQPRTVESRVGKEREVRVDIGGSGTIKKQKKKYKV